ncbi:GhoT/OrtT family toxin [Salmonella enterica subsp. enterica serovar Poona]|nr:GhoT/OrtT family toxin [Salmonella enterica subsp. enterica serovar Newport]ECO1514458.1 GhoT/OrtT family toxin [Salmonella enterica subsp. arizonae]EDJ2556906.1 GhoT/OrtT family toxin [Salmonella enterica subsp. enterica serovar Poona]
MSLYKEILLVYNIMAILSGLIIWFISYEKKSIRLLSAILVGVTWPMSFPVALLFSLL